MTSILELIEKMSRHDCEPLRSKYRKELVAAVKELETERDAARAEVERVKGLGLIWTAERIDALIAERDQLLAEVEQWKREFHNERINGNAKADKLQSDLDALTLAAATRECELMNETGKLRAEVERLRNALNDAEYLVGAFERGCDSNDYFRDIADFRASAEGKQ